MSDVRICIIIIFVSKKTKNMYFKAKHLTHIRQTFSLNYIPIYCLFETNQMLKYTLNTSIDIIFNSYFSPHPFSNPPFPFSPMHWLIAWYCDRLVCLELIICLQSPSLFSLIYKRCEKEIFLQKSICNKDNFISMSKRLSVFINAYIYKKIFIRLFTIFSSLKSVFSVCFRSWQRSKTL
jgi:hypothetical protein